MLKEVPTVKTQHTDAEFITALIIAWQEMFQEIPKKESISVIFGQNYLETGGSAHEYCNNIGNIKAVDSPNQEIDYCVLQGVWEIIGGQRVVLPPSNPGSWFRAFPDLDSGIKFYLDFLKNHHFKNAWPAIIAGDPKSFATLLKQSGYFTAPLADYIAGLNTFYNKCMSSGIYEQVIAQLSAPVVPLVPVVISPPPQPSPSIPPVVLPTTDITASSGNLISSIGNAVSKVFNFFK